MPDLKPFKASHCGPFHASEQSVRPRAKIAKREANSAVERKFSRGRRRSSRWKFGCQAISRWEHQHNCVIFAPVPAISGQGSEVLQIMKFPQGRKATCKDVRLRAGDGLIHSRKHQSTVSLILKKGTESQTQPQRNIQQSHVFMISWLGWLLDNMATLRYHTKHHVVAGWHDMISISSNNNPRSYLVTHPSYSKWIVTPVINEMSRINPNRTGEI